MWARIAEILLGSWLVASPSIIGYGEGAGTPLIPLVAGIAVLVLSASTFKPRFRRSHLGNLLVAGFLILWGWSQAARPGPGWAQNQIMVGLLLGLFAVVPTHATRSPEGWQRYVREQEQE